MYQWQMAIKWLQLECQREWIQRHHRFGSCIWSYPQLCILGDFGGPMIFAAAESLQPRLDPWRASHIGTAWIYQRVEKLTCRGVLSFLLLHFQKIFRKFSILLCFPYFSILFPLFLWILILVEAEFVPRPKPVRYYSYGQVRLWASIRASIGATDFDETDFAPEFSAPTICHTVSSKQVLANAQHLNHQQTGQLRPAVDATA